MSDDIFSEPQMFHSYLLRMWREPGEAAQHVAVSRYLVMKVGTDESYAFSSLDEVYEFLKHRLQVDSFPGNTSSDVSPP